MAAGIEIVAIFCLFMIWQSQSADAQPIWLFGSVVCGLVAGLAIGKITEYFCSDKYKPVHKIAEAADTGAATVIIEGLGTGMLSTIAPIVLVALAIIGAFACGNMAFPNVVVENGGIAVGLFGVGLAATGHAVQHGHHRGRGRLRPRGRQCRRHRRDGGLDPKRCASAPTRWTPWATRRPPSRKGFAIASAGLAAISLFVSYQATDAPCHRQLRAHADRPHHRGRRVHRRHACRSCSPP